MRLPQELLAEALWNETYFKDGILTYCRIEELLQRYNLKLRKGKKVEDVKLAFSRGFKKAYGINDLILKQVAEEIDKICIIARWDFAIGKYTREQKEIPQ